MKILLTLVAALGIGLGNLAYAQILDEQNVTLTMDLQPVLQLKLEGSNQIDFTFDEINEYYGGITQYGANVLKVSASVTFDLWAVGLSQGNTGTPLTWDQQVDYTGGSANAVNTIPLTALELHQFPQNPTVTAGADCTGNGGATASADYSTPFQTIDLASGANAAGATGNNCIYTTAETTPYIAPVSTGVNTTEEKYIAGGQDAGAVAGCGIVGGSYLTESMNFTNAAVAGPPAGAAGSPAAAGYYFVMDYRILPGLPAKFPMHQAANNENGNAASLAAAELAGGALSTDANAYAAPGVYTMNIKYIIAEDQ